MRPRGRIERVAACAAVTTLALAGAADARTRELFPPRFRADPPRDVAAGALDVRRVAFDQRGVRMDLEIQTRGPWATRRLGSERTLCLVVSRPAGRLCVVRGGARGAAYLRWAPRRGAARVVPAAVSRPDRRSVRARFAPRALGLRIGPLRWSLETRWDGARDRVPDRGRLATSVALVGQPRCFGAAARDPVRPCRNASLRRTALPRPVDAFLWDNGPCRRMPAARRGAFEPCEFGVTGAERTSTFLIIGDSHAMHWRPALEVVAEARRWRGVSVARPGCPFSARIPRSPALGPGACAGLHRAALAWLRTHPEVETVFVSNWAPPGSSAIGGTGAYGGGATAFGAMLDRLPPSVRRVYVLRDIPRTFPRSVDCVKSRRRRGLPLVRSCPVPRSTALIPDPGAAAAAARRPRARGIDLTRHFCDRSRCFPVIGGAFVYKDLDHMNAVFSASLGPFLQRALGAP